jgi:hypothetical protein
MNDPLQSASLEPKSPVEEPMKIEDLTERFDSPSEEYLESFEGQTFAEDVVSDESPDPQVEIVKESTDEPEVIKSESEPNLNAEPIADPECESISVSENQTEDNSTPSVSLEVSDEVEDSPALPICNSPELKEEEPTLPPVVDEPKITEIAKEIEDAELPVDLNSID